MSKYVISTLTAANRYTSWTKSGGVNMEGRGVLVRGGAGLALATGGRHMVTPQGVRTEVSDSDAEFLLAHPLFKEHMKHGVVRIVNSAQEPDKAAKSMEADKKTDAKGLPVAGSSPVTPKDVDEANKKLAQSADGTPALQAVLNKSK